jgi:chromosome segregation ATPase
MEALSAVSWMRDASAADSVDIERSSIEGLSEIGSDLSHLRHQADDLNRGVETVTWEVRRAVESLQEHAQQAERELRAVETQVGDLRSAFDSLQSRADVLRRKIGEMEGRASDLLGATERAVETGVLESQLRDAIHQQLLPRLADFRTLLVQVDELLARLQEGWKRLGHLQEVTRELTEVIMRVRHLARN